jgi:hypothetical protein
MKSGRDASAIDRLSEKIRVDQDKIDIFAMA